MSHPQSRTVVYIAAVSSHSHTMLAGQYLRGIAERAGWTWIEIETVSTASYYSLLSRLQDVAPDAVAATFYLFNRSFLLSLLARFKAVHPDTPLIGGGPEFLGNNRRFLEQHRFVDAVIRGEGEIAFQQWLESFEEQAAWAQIPGFCGFINSLYIDNGLAMGPESLDDIPSPYAVTARPDTLKKNKPFVMLETSRGCANHCSFCTHGLGESVRAKSLGRIQSELDALQHSGIPEIRLLDRTFNDAPDRYLPLIRLFRDRYPDLRFHLEIDPARVTPSLIRELSSAKPGRFHLETGIQSLTPDVLANVRRQATVTRSLEGLKQLLALPGIGIHADLIAGLPGGSLQDLYRDLEILVALGPHEIQLEVLKLLPGTALEDEREKWRLIAASEAPYEVLQTALMSGADMETAYALSRLTDWYYNPPELRGICRDASRALTDFWKTLVARHGDAVQLPVSPSLETRLRFLNALFEEHGTPLAHALRYQWLKMGFSAQHGIAPARPWTGPVPADAVRIEGVEGAFAKRIFQVDLDASYWFAYGKERQAVAVCRRPF